MIDEVLKELEKYTDIDHSETTEVCEHLTNLLMYEGYISDELREAIEKGLEDQLEAYKSCCVIDEREVVVPERRFITKSLTWF